MDVLGHAYASVRTRRTKGWTVEAVLGSPWTTASVAVLVGATVVMGRLVLVDHGDVTRFIGLGVIYTHRAALPRGLFVGPGAGWDGQYFYRLALDPLNLHRSAFGITLDTPYRLQRIGYPLLAWLAAGGRVALLPWSMVGVNVVALGVLGGLGGVLARDADRSPMWGLLLAGYWGFPFAISWDLTESVIAALMVATVLALRRERVVWATAALTAAVLTKETALILVGAIAVAELLSIFGPAKATVVGTSRLAPARLTRHVVWAVPLIVFAAWQVMIRISVGRPGLGSDTGANLGLPMVAAAGEMLRDLRHLGNIVDLIDLTQILLLVGLTVLAIGVSVRQPFPLRERLALVAMTILALCLSSAVWAGQKDLRSLAELFALATVVLISSNRRLLVPATLVGYAWGLAALMQATKP